ncbi:MAG: sugar phosphate isomerase/epimerase [Balneolaceae bacterium]
MFIFILACSEQKPVPEQNDKNIGVQIYSVRNELAQNFDSTLAKLSEIGFDYIEAYGLSTDGLLYGMEPSEYKKAVESHGMKLISSHSTYFTVEDAPIMIEAAKEAGLEYVIIPYLSDDLRNDYDTIAENLNSVGALFKEAGIGFGYHNHEFEFELTDDGRVPMEILIEGTDPQNVDFQLDLYWVVKAKADPLEFINKYPGRFKAFHVKDSDSELNQTTVGTGIVDFKTILTEQQTSGFEYYFVEDERTDDPFSNLTNAFNYLQKLDF